MKRGAGDDPFGETDGNTDDDTMNATTTDEPTKEPETETIETPEQPIVDTLTHALETIKDGNASKHIGYRDDLSAALLAAMSESEQLRTDLAADLGDALDRDIDPADLDRSEVVRHLVRIGLKNGSPETFDALADAHAEIARRNL